MFSAAGWCPVPPPPPTISYPNADDAASRMPRRIPLSPPQMPKPDFQIMEQVLNFHGQQLKKILDDEHGELMQLFPNKNSLDFHVYQQRVKELGMEDRGKRLKLHQFISSKLCDLYIPLSKEEEQKKSLIELCTQSVKDAYAVMPPLEHFLRISKHERKDRILEGLEKGDLVVGTVFHSIHQKYLIRVHALDGPKARFISDINLKGSLHVQSIPPGQEALETGTLIRCEVLQVHSLENIICGLLGQFVSPELAYQYKLGIISETDLPKSFRLGLNLTANDTYDSFLHSNFPFNHPGNVGLLCRCFGLDETSPPTLIESLQKNFPEEQMAKALHERQASAWARSKVKQGITYLKEGKYTEAFQMFNTALQTHPESVDAYVARGALFFNRGNFKKAEEDFRKALDIDPSHTNGRKYYFETLINLGDQYKEAKDFDAARKCYEKVLSLSPQHHKAVEAMQKMNQRKIEEGLQGLDTKEKLKKLIKEEEGEEEEKKQKKREKLDKEDMWISSSSPSSDSSSESLDSSSSSHSSSDRKGRRFKSKRRRSSRSEKRQKKKKKRREYQRRKRERGSKREEMAEEVKEDKERKQEDLPVLQEVQSQSPPLQAMNLAFPINLAFPPPPIPVPPPLLLNNNASGGMFGPGYPKVPFSGDSHYSKPQDTEYDEKVRKFLEQVSRKEDEQSRSRSYRSRSPSASPSSHCRHHSRGHSREVSEDGKSRHRKHHHHGSSEQKSREKERGREKEKEKQKGKGMEREEMGKDRKKYESIEKNDKEETNNDEKDKEKYAASMGDMHVMQAEYVQLQVEELSRRVEELIKNPEAILGKKGSMIDAEDRFLYGEDEEKSKKEKDKGKEKGRKKRKKKRRVRGSSEQKHKSRSSSSSLSVSSFHSSSSSSSVSRSSESLLYAKKRRKEKKKHSEKKRKKERERGKRDKEKKRDRKVGETVLEGKRAKKQEEEEDKGVKNQKDEGKYCNDDLRKIFDMFGDSPLQTDPTVSGNKKEPLLRITRTVDLTSDSKEKRTVMIREDTDDEEPEKKKEDTPEKKRTFTECEGGIHSGKRAFTEAIPSSKQPFNNKEVKRGGGEEEEHEGERERRPYTFRGRMGYNPRFQGYRGRWPRSSQRGWNPRGRGPRWRGSGVYIPRRRRSHSRDRYHRRYRSRSRSRDHRSRSRSRDRHSRSCSQKELSRSRSRDEQSRSHSRERQSRSNSRTQSSHRPVVSRTSRWETEPTDDVTPPRPSEARINAQDAMEKLKKEQERLRLLTQAKHQEELERAQQIELARRKINEQLESIDQGKGRKPISMTLSGKKTALEIMAGKWADDEEGGGLETKEGEVKSESRGDSPAPGLGRRAPVMKSLQEVEDFIQKSKEMLKKRQQDVEDKPKKFLRPSFL
ncbi:unnamed protein product [Darwinula stevensoni]|uniref:Tetratricopeptide repeat protein 14 n=1 Tax=Darwinula stevensoni TaxID=69355 RepID=A0A7R8X4E4_9CRUS|nr:unnamed protein product [Darwinula stevensoni]CAG0883424.1 unnamed protein product [Darwinula stevensoni]